MTHNGLEYDFVATNPLGFSYWKSGLKVQKDCRTITKPSNELYALLATGFNNHFYIFCNFHYLSKKNNILSFFPIQNLYLLSKLPNLFHKFHYRVYKNHLLVLYHLIYVLSMNLIKVFLFDIRALKYHQEINQSVSYRNRF